MSCGVRCKYYSELFFTWVLNNKMIVFLSLLSFCLFVSVLALSGEKRYLLREVEELKDQMANPTTPEEAPDTVPPTTTLAPNPPPLSNEESGEPSDNSQPDGQQPDGEDEQQPDGESEQNPESKPDGESSADGDSNTDPKPEGENNETNPKTAPLFEGDDGYFTDYEDEISVKEMLLNMMK